jgi:hypothetical protein
MDVAISEIQEGDIGDRTGDCSGTSLTHSWCRTSAQTTPMNLKKPGPIFYREPSHMHGQNIAVSTSELQVASTQAMNGCSERLTSHTAWMRRMAAKVKNILQLALTV